MKWEEAVAKSPIKMAYRKLVDGRISTCRENGETRTETTKDGGQFKPIGPQARNRRTDWEPMPKGGILALVDGDVEQIDVDFQIKCLPAEKSQAKAIQAMADLASRWLDRGHEIQAALITQLLARYMM